MRDVMMERRAMVIEQIDIGPYSSSIAKQNNKSFSLLVMKLLFTLCTLLVAAVKGEIDSEEFTSISNNMYVDDIFFYVGFD